MNIGDKFDTTGFEVVARINTVDSGDEILVMHNNSTHYHVAVMSSDDETEAMLTASFRYYADPSLGVDYVVAYRMALRKATDEAVRR